MKPLYALDQLTGNYNITGLIKRSLMNNSLTYFTILDGDHGTGKTTTAKMIAMYLTCEDEGKKETGRPCTKCPSCKSAISNVLLQNTSSSRITLIDMGKRDISSDKLNTQLFKLDNKGDVIIIDEAHAMSNDMQLAINIEIENNTDAHIIMCTTKAYKLLPELRDRGHIFNYKRLRYNDAKLLADKIVQDRGYVLDTNIRDMIISYAKGTPRKLIQMVDFICQTKPSIEQIEEHLDIISSNVFIDILEGSTLDMFMYRKILIDYEAAYGADKLLRGFKEFLVDAIFRITGKVMGNLGNTGHKMLKGIGYFKLNHILLEIEDLEKRHSYGNTVTDVMALGIKIRNILLGYSEEDIINQRYKQGAVFAEDSREISDSIKQEQKEEQYNEKILTPFNLDSI